MKKESKGQRYRIYSGLSGGFGGATLQCTEEFSSQDDADSYAYECALENYASYEGLHGLRDVAQVAEEEGVDDDEAEEIYMEEREGWLDYYSELETEEKEDG